METVGVDHGNGSPAPLDRIGASATGPIETFKVRPWSTVAHVSTDAGRLWFKANEHALSFEAGLLVVLAELTPDRVTAPLEWSRETGWFLAPDGGPTGAEVQVPADGAIDAIVEVQRGTATALDDVLAAGTPDRRPAQLPVVLDEAIAHPSSGAGGRRCADLRGRFAEACELLAADGRLTVVNSDHKPAHVFAGPPLRLYDWGDAAVSHPLTDVPFVAREFGPEGAARLVAAWGHTDDDPIVHAAGAAAELIEADVWLRTSAEGLARHPDGIDVALRRLADRLVRTADFG